MADVAEWRLKGDWFDVCKCTIPCPCMFAQAPSDGDCDAFSPGIFAREAAATCASTA